jgi:hypothetical protein
VSFNQELEQAQLLSQLTGEPLTPGSTRNTYRLLAEQTRLIGILAASGVGAGTVDESPPPDEPEPLPPVEETDPEPEVVEPVILAQDSYIPDPYAFSVYNKPRLSAAGTADYLPPALTGVPGTARYFGMRFAGHSSTLAFRRVEVPLRRKNILPDQQLGIQLLKRVGDVWVTVASRYVITRANLARVWWDYTFVFAPGEEWAIIAGINGSSDVTTQFYGSASPYPAPYGSSGIGLDSSMPSTAGKLYTLTTAPGSHRMLRLYGVNLPKDVSGPLDSADLPAGTAKVVTLTQAQFDALAVKDPNTFYSVV